MSKQETTDKEAKAETTEAPASKKLTEKDLPEDLSTWHVARESGHVYVKESEDGKFFTVVQVDGDERLVDNIDAEKFNQEYEILTPAKL
jgi:hypothetical protein